MCGCGYGYKCPAYRVTAADKAVRLRWLKQQVAEAEATVTAETVASDAAGAESEAEAQIFVAKIIQLHDLLRRREAGQAAPGGGRRCGGRQRARERARRLQAAEADRGGGEGAEPR